MTSLAEEPALAAAPPSQPRLEGLGLGPPFAFAFRRQGIRFDASCAAGSAQPMLRVVAAPLQIPFTSEDTEARRQLLSLVGRDLDAPPIRFIVTAVQGIRFEGEMAMERLDPSSIIGTAVALLLRAKPYFALLPEQGGAQKRPTPSAAT
jgi:hypothetical protein